MKSILLPFLFVCIAAAGGYAQSPTLDKHQTLTWLGVDFTQLRFIGAATQYKDLGDITNADLRGKYFPGWNDLILREPTRYDIGKATGFDAVDNATDAVTKANNRDSKANYFSDNGNEFERLNATAVAALLKKYDFGGKKGTGLIVFVEGMDKGREQTSMWVVFVEMESRIVLASKHYVENAGGMGFRNFWASSFNRLFKHMKGDF